MNRSDIVQSVATREQLPVAYVQRVVDALLEVVGLSLACGESVNLRSFGKFEPRHRRPVVRKNPRTGVEHQVPEKTAIGFVASPTLKRRVNETT